MTGRTYTYEIPGDLDFIGTMRWTREEAADTLRLIERAQEADIAEYPENPHLRLVEVVRRRAQDARRRLESGDMTAEQAGAEIEALTARIHEIRLRAAEPDRTRGAKVRAAARAGGAARRGRLKADTLEILDYVRAGMSYNQVAMKFRKSKSAVAKLVRRHKGEFSLKQ